jgi:hypothetical protein
MRRLTIVKRETAEMETAEMETAEMETAEMETAEMRLMSASTIRKTRHGSLGSIIFAPLLNTYMELVCTKWPSRSKVRFGI